MRLRWLSRTGWASVLIAAVVAVVFYYRVQRGDPSVPQDLAIGREVSGAELKKRLAFMAPWSGEENVLIQMTMQRYSEMAPSAQQHALNVYRDLRQASDRETLAEIARRYTTYYESLSIKEKTEFNALRTEAKLARIHRDQSQPPRRLSRQDGEILATWSVTFMRERFREKPMQMARLVREFKQLRRLMYGNVAQTMQERTSPDEGDPANESPREDRPKYLLSDQQVLNVLHSAIISLLDPKDRPASTRRIADDRMETLNRFAKELAPGKNDLPIKHFQQQGMSPSTVRALASFNSDDDFYKAMASWLYSMRFPGKTVAASDLQAAFEKLSEEKKREYLLLPKEEMRGRLIYGDDYRPETSDVYEEYSEVFFNL